MSWSFTAIARDKLKLKSHVHDKLKLYHQVGNPAYALADKIATQLCQLIDMFELVPDQLIKIETSGHMEGGDGSIMVDITNYCGTVID